MNAGNLKGPFKGKGGKLDRWASCIEAGPDALEPELERRRARRDAIKQQLRQLAAQVVATWSKPPLRLVYSRGQGYVWRKRASRPGDESLIASLAQPQAMRLLESLDPHTRRRYLRIEERRLDLNTQWQILSYEIRTLETWAGRRIAVRQMLGQETSAPVADAFHEKPDSRAIR